MAAQHYEVIYGNQLADDLHNLFPDLIYSPTRFSNVQDVLQYMQTRMRNRFDLFSMARGLHAPVQTYAAAASTNANANATTTSAPNPPSVANPSTPQTRSTPLNPPVINSSRVYRQTATNMNPISLLSAFEIASDEEVNPISTAILTNLLTPFFNTTGMGALDPVIVRPTQAQIASATEVFSNTIANSETCTICLDNLPVGSQVRKIKACGHQFHKTCIDQWFESHVRCPVCRHDIRESQSTTSSSGGSSNSDI